MLGVNYLSSTNPIIDPGTQFAQQRGCKTEDCSNSRPSTDDDFQVSFKACQFSGTCTEDPAQKSQPVQRQVAEGSNQAGGNSPTRRHISSSNRQVFFSRIPIGSPSRFRERFRI